MASDPPNRTSEIRKDPIFNKWVIISSARSRRPSDFKSAAGNPKNPKSCPFCAGRETECAPEIFRVPETGPDWRIRVIENLYPALQKDLGFERSELDGFDALKGFGFHDVVIETPDHGVRLSDLTAEGVGDVVMAYKERVEQLRKVGSIEYVQVFKNHGASAGASMSHSHSQIMGLPIIPPNVTTRLNTMKDYFDRTGKCSLCEVLSKELLIDESTHFFSIVPHAASYPFEIWVIPRDHLSYFQNIDHEKATDLGGLLKLMLMKLSLQLNDPPFNFMIHTSPFQMQDSCLPYAHWFLQIVPQLSVIGGFEIGSGCYINPVFPEDAAKVLREVNLNVRNH